MPTLLWVSMLAVSAPLSPGFRRLELAITAVHPQETCSFSMTNSPVPVFPNANENSSLSPSLTFPKSWVSLSNVMEGAAYPATGMNSAMNRTMHFINNYTIVADGMAGMKQCRSI